MLGVGHIFENGIDSVTATWLADSAAMSAMLTGLLVGRQRVNGTLCELR